MGDGLRLTADERRAAALAAVEALERLADLRATGPLHHPAGADLVAAARGAPPQEAGDLAAILERFTHIALAGWDKTAGGGLAYIPNGALESGPIAALLAAGANTFTGTAFEAPAMVAMEEGLLRWMADLLGLPASAGGLLLSGGSLANGAAIVSARARAAGRPGSAAEVGAAATMVVSDRVHHSITRAAALAGIPSTAARVVGTDAAGRMDTEALVTLLRDDRAAGRRPFLVVGVAGTTDSGAIDPLERLADIAAEAGAWLHVDAAYGGFFALTGRGRERLRGIERADSVTVDAHKGLFLPYGVGAVLVRDAADLLAAHHGAGAYFRGLPVTEGLPDYCQRGPELTRPSRGPLLWFPLQLHGTAAFAAELDRMLDLAAMAHARLAAMPGVITGPAPQLSIVAFRAAAGDAMTDAIVAALQGSGRFQVSTTTLGGRAMVRFAFLSPRTDAATIEEALGIVARTVGAEPGT